MAKEMLVPASQEVRSAHYSKIKNVAGSVKNEAMEMIAKLRAGKAGLNM